MAPTAEPDKSKLLDQALRRYFEQSIHMAAEIDVSYQRLWQTLYGLILSGGKRIRPHMTLLAYEAFGGKDIESAMPVALAQELLHFSLLIHDDVIDRDYTRYGTLNVAGRYQQMYAQYLVNASDQTHYAHSAAILGGDLILSGAHGLIASSTIDASLKVKIQQILSTSIFEVAGGELLDTEQSFLPSSSSDALKIARYKTSSYSFVGPLTTGATMAGASNEDISTLRSFAISLGIAFQLADDILGVFGDETVTGKSTTSDIIEGKKTYTFECALETMTDNQKLRFDQVYGNQQATPAEIDEARSLLVSTGARRRTETKVEELTAQARDALHRLNLSEHHQVAFENLIAKATRRTR